MKKRIKTKKQKRNAEQALKKLEAKTKRDLGQTFGGMVQNVPGEISMSDALENVIEPYMDKIFTLEAAQNLVGIGALAWNLALRPSEEVAQELPKLAKGMAHERGDAAMLTEVITEMVERKRTLYPDVNRYIVNFQVEDIGDGWHLAVASTTSLKD